MLNFAAKIQTFLLAVLKAEQLRFSNAPTPHWKGRHQMKSSKPVEAQSMCEELLKKIQNKSMLFEIRDLLITFKRRGVRAPQIAHFLMGIVIKNQTMPESAAMHEKVEDKLLDVIDMVLGTMAEEYTIWQGACKWRPSRPIYYLDNLCPACNTGILGFRRLDEASKIVIVCHECEAVWMQPYNIALENMRRVSEPDFIVLELECPIFGDNAAWASYEEIKIHGWEEYIYGDERPLY